MHNPAHNIVILMADLATAEAVKLASDPYNPPGGELMPPPIRMLQSTDGRYASIHWAWPAAFLAAIAVLNVETFDRAPTWKADHNWVDKEPPEGE